MLSVQTLTAAEAVLNVAVGLHAEGRYGDAREILAPAIEDLPGDAAQIDRLKLNYMLALVEQSDGRLEESLAVLVGICEAVEQCEDFVFKGKYYNALGYTYRRLGRLDEAIEVLSGSLYWLDCGGSSVLKLHVENNLGNLLMDAGRFDEADEHYERALAGCRDAFARAQVFESRAAALLKHGLPMKALSPARKAVELVEESERLPLIKEHVKTLRLVCEAVEKQIKLDEERPKIQSALVESGGKITQAARILHMPPASLSWKLENQHPDLLPLRSERKRSRGRHVKKA